MIHLYLVNIPLLARIFTACMGAIGEKWLLNGTHASSDIEPVYAAVFLKERGHMPHATQTHQEISSAFYSTNTNSLFFKHSVCVIVIGLKKPLDGQQTCSHLKKKRKKKKNLVRCPVLRTFPSHLLTNLQTTSRALVHDILSLCSRIFSGYTSLV